MARSDAQKRARAKYEKEKVKQVMVRFYPSENDILEFLESQDNKAGYIKELIRKDMNSQR
jgi:hypothetical protein|nr:MAG TPA: hypothetical protein [Caudoviricetes sp.]